MPHTLLLADDSVTIRRVIELTFADEGVTVTSFSSGREAIAGIEASPPDIVLADAGMADVSGYEIAAFVKGRPDLRHIPVVLLAGAFEPLDEARARQAGSDGVLVKPFEPQMAVARVRELLSNARPAAAPAFTAPAPAFTTPAAASAAPASASTAPAPSPTPLPTPPVPLPADATAELEIVHASDPSFDASLDRLDEAFASGASQGAPALDSSTATEFADDLRELRSGRVDSGGFERQDFGDWDLPRPAGQPAAPEEDYLDALSDRGPAPLPPVTLQPLPPSAPPAPAAAPPVALPDRAAAATPAFVAPLRPAAAPFGPAAAAAPLADAFSSLLAAEEGRPHAPLPGAQGFGAQPGGPLTANDMEAIVDRLIERLGPDVRVAVMDLAERLVKAEIDRLKALR